MNYDRDFENNNLQNEEKQKSDNNKNEQTDLKIDNRKLDNQEKEKNSQEKEQIQRRWRKQPPEVCWSFIKLLKRLKKENKQVSVIISSGNNCCQITGCIARMVNKKYITLLTTNNINESNNNSDTEDTDDVINPSQTSNNDICKLIHVRIKCICAISIIN